MTIYDVFTEMTDIYYSQPVGVELHVQQNDYQR